MDLVSCAPFPTPSGLKTLTGHIRTQNFSSEFRGSRHLQQFVFRTQNSELRTHNSQLTLRRLLIQVDLVAIQILECYSGTPRLDLRFAVESNTGILHPAIVSYTVIGHDPKEGLRPSLLAHQGSILVGFSQIESDRQKVILRQPNRDPSLRSKGHILGQ